LRAALAWALADHDAEAAVRICVALDDYWNLRDWREAAHWLGKALAIAGDNLPSPLFARALWVRAFQLATPDTSAQAEAAARRSITLHQSLGDVRGLADGLFALAWVLLERQRVEDARPVAERAVAAAIEANDPIVLADARRCQAMSAPTIQDALRAAALAADYYRSVGNFSRLAMLDVVLTSTAIYLGDLDAAAELAQRARSGLEAIAAPPQEPWLCIKEGLIALLNQDVPHAAAAFRRGIEISQNHHFDRVLFESLTGIAAVCALTARDDDAARYSAAAQHLTRACHNTRIQQRIDELCFTPARARAGVVRWARAAGDGRRLDRATATAEALRAADEITVHTAL
jgi:tetratricopeptide (TPR) repeat protein